MALGLQRGLASRNVNCYASTSSFLHPLLRKQQRTTALPVLRDVPSQLPYQVERPDPKRANRELRRPWDQSPKTPASTSALCLSVPICKPEQSSWLHERGIHSRSPCRSRAAWNPVAVCLGPFLFPYRWHTLGDLGSWSWSWGGPRTWRQLLVRALCGPDVAKEHA